MSTTTKDTTNKIAVVGMSCRFPGARSVHEYWSNLREGVESRREVTAEDLAKARLDPTFSGHPQHVPVAFTLDDVGGFDASFFYLNAREAEKMDPQLRVFLETAWHALEDAGYNSENFGGDIGVFASGLGSTYLLSNLLTSTAHYAGDVHALQQDMVARMGNDTNYLATRTSYHLNLTGPSISVQTACSSSLVAVHQAVESLLRGECDVALAGGVSIRFPHAAGYVYEPDGILSRDGHCRPFDAQATGTVFGDGAGIVTLRRLDDALADGDTVHAVILASAIGNDGADKVGFSAPSVSGQIKVIENALGLAGIDRSSVGYVEGHGTGTQMGDPIEVQSLKMVFADTPPGQRIGLGSVKGNVGHLSVAAGMAGLIKTVLMLKHGELVPTINFDAPNPDCGLEDGPFWVPQATQAWAPGAELRRAGVSSFGMGGTNCHVVLEEAPPPELSPAARPVSIVAVSAKSPEALSRATQSLASALSEGKVALGDAEYTLAMGRRTFNFRQAIVAESTPEAIEALQGRAPAALVSGSGQPAAQPVTFMFPGQGAQYTGMLQGCYSHEAVFAEVVDGCAAILKPLLGLDIRELLFPALFPTAAAPGRLDETQYTQPTLFVVEYALARLWMHWGIRPTAMIGHSVGEYAAACLAGVFALEDALKLIAARGRLIQALPAGSMLAVPLAMEDLQARLPPGLDIAATNEPGACTVSGPAERIEQFAQALAKDRVPARKLPTSHAFHSAMMEPARAQMLALFDGIALSAPVIPIVSNLTGTWMTAEQACSPVYWADHLRQAVRFAEGTETLLRTQAQQVLIEVGPGQALASFVRRHPEKEIGHQVLTSLGRTKEPVQEHRSVLTALAKLWCLGLSIDWPAYFHRERRRRVPLPGYPFEREHFFAEPSLDYRHQAAAGDDDRKTSLERWSYAPVWKQSIDTCAAAPSPVAGPLLLFADRGGVGQALMAAVPSDGLVVVCDGPELQLELPDRLVIRSDVKEDYHSLIAHLQKTGRLPATVVHLWSLDAPPAGLDRERFELAQRYGVYGLTFMVQALASLNITNPMAWHVVTRSAYSVLGDEQLAPEQSTVNVFAKVISQEYAQIDCRLLDLGSSTPEAAARAVGHELSQRSQREYAVADRHGKRWTLQMERVSQPPTWGHKNFTRLAKGDVYLITGGLGEIGTTLARMLANDYQARLALLVREPMPAPAQWDEHLQQHEDDQVARRIRIVRELEGCGAEVLVVQADVADPHKMTAAVGAVVGRFGRLDGVFHAAGLPGEKWDRTIESAGVEQIRWHFQAKAFGVQVLAKVLDTVRPKFCLLVSSIASMLGGLRLGPYGAANHYMDNFAALMNRQQLTTRWVTVDWDVWQHHQDEKRESSAIGRMMDERTVLPEQGLEVIERVLAMSDVHQIAVSTWDMDVRARRWVRREALAGSTTGRSSSASAAEAGTSLEADVLGLLNATLGRDVLQPQDDFFEAGGDSLISLQLLTTVRERYKVNVSLARFLSRPTAQSLTALIQEQMKPEEDEVLAFIQRSFLPEQEDLLLSFIEEIRAMATPAVAA
jgi:acyl transferase domain-containing protein/acyl carrier protein